MKKIISLLLLLCSVYAYSQYNLPDVGKITMCAVVPESENLPEEARKLLQTRLSQIITASGVADDEYCVRFVLKAKVNVLSKDIVAGPPQRIVQKLEITLMVGDVEANKVFAQQIVPAVGIGETYEKCFISAIKNTNPTNSAIQSFMEEAKTKVFAFYQSSCEDILAEARRLSSEQKFDEALMLLGSVPDVCSDCFRQAAQMATVVYEDMINVRGEELLSSARAAWTANPTREGAAEAVRYLSEVNGAANCQPQVAQLFDEIGRKTNELDQREWQQQMQEYSDRKAREEREWQQQQRELDAKVECQRQWIKACRDVAVARAKNQPKIVNRYIYYKRIVLW